VVNKFKMAKHFEVSIGENTLSVSRHEDAIAAEAALDGIYVLRTTIKESDLDAPVSRHVIPFFWRFSVT
jgi:hypothetical protein